MKHGKNTVLFLTQQGVKQKITCETFTHAEKNTVRASEQARESAIERIVGSCYTSKFVNSLPKLTFESVKKTIEREDIDFVEISSFDKDNLDWEVRKRLLREYPEKIIMPTGTWKTCNDKIHYYFIFDPKVDHYLSEEKAIRFELGMCL